MTFSYDNRGRLESETDVFGRVLEYGYDANGNRTSLELDGNTHTTYAYDVADRLTTLTDDASQNYTYGYDIADRLISKALPNGITTTYDYDGMSRLTRLKDATVGSTLLDRQYSYNTANQISAITEPSRIRTFGYDNINRLTSATDSLLGTEAYAFDAVGNHTSSPWSSTYTHQPFNRLAATQTATYGHDSNGNTTSKVEGLTSWTYSWDRENRLTNASSGTASVDYVYDALGRRVKRIDGADTTEFTHDGEDVLLDDSSVSGTKTYQNGPGIDNKLSVKAGINTSYLLTNHLGSTDALTDASGAITASQIYDSFGNASNGAFSSRYQFTGRERDDATGLQFSRARFYDPQLGRFISEDPIGFAGGDVNLYGYILNRPNQGRDPFGRDIVGVAGSGSIFGGLPGPSAGGTAGCLVGYGSDGLGSACSYGSFYGPGRTPADIDRHAGWAAGGGAGAGGGFFWTNADQWCELAGPASTTIVGFGLYGSIQVDYAGNGLVTIQGYPGFLGKGTTYGITHFGTQTPPTATGRFSDAMDELKLKFRNGMRDIYGY